MRIVQWILKTKIGPIHLAASANGLKAVSTDPVLGECVRSLNNSEPEVKILAEAVRQLKEYLKGKRKNFDLPLDATGTAFQKQVWNQLNEIPYGKTCSYKQIAEKIKNDKAVRAVGSANGKNPLFIIVPCHRVIASDGTLGGYSGGIEVKMKLLNLEKKVFLNPEIKN